MLTRFDVLLIVLLVLSISGWPQGFAHGIPEPLRTIAVVIIFIVLLLLGVTRFG